VLDLKSSAKHRKLTGTAATCGERSLVAQNRVVPGFLENAFVDDNDLFQFTTKTKASAPENRRVETAIATNIPAKLSAAQIGAIHDPLSPPPSRLVPGPWGTHRAKLPLNDHASSNAHQARVRCLATRPATFACMSHHVSKQVTR